MISGSMRPSHLRLSTANLFHNYFRPARTQSATARMCDCILSDDMVVATFGLLFRLNSTTANTNNSERGNHAYGRWQYE